MAAPRSTAPRATARATAALTLCATVALAAAAPAPARADRLDQQKHLIELGAFAGVAVISDQHELYNVGQTQHQLGAALFEVGLRMAYLPLFFVGGEVELAIAPTEANDTAVMLHAMRWHLIAQYPIGGRFAPFVVVGGGYLALLAGDSGGGGDLDPAFHWGAGAKVYLWGDVMLRFDVRHLVSARNGAGETNHFEALLGVSWVLNWINDKDKDGRPDDKDRCPTVAADTSDGCPEKDSDGDGIVDQKDRCPSQPAVSKDGCPIRDRDWDGIPDSRDKCPTKPETRNGYNDEDGCPDTPPGPKVPKGFGGTLAGVTFASGKARIRKSSFSSLDKAVAVLKKHPKLRVTIRGHTDNRGSKVGNVRLSRARARAVKKYLVRKGISASRLSVEGVGPAEPVADNKTRAGRAKNRRIEFKITTR